MKESIQVSILIIFCFCFAAFLIFVGTGKIHGKVVEPSLAWDGSLNYKVKVNGHTECSYDTKEEAEKALKHLKGE